MKGTIEEMIYSVVVVLVVFMLFVFFTQQSGTRGVEVRKTVEERILNEEGSAAVFSLFNNKLLFAEKTYLECGIDSILQGNISDKEINEVFYGMGTGKVNVTEIIPSMLDRYAEGRWELRVITPDGEYTYGGIESNKVMYTYESLIPVPEERSGKVILLLG